MFVKITKSVFGKHIRLTEERWQHIIERHPEIAGCLTEVLETVFDPDIVTCGWRDEVVAIKKFRYQDVAVIYKEIDGFVITAFQTRSRKYFEKRGIIWSKQN